MDEFDEVSELKVLKSAAGYYIGRDTSENGLIMPYSRDSNCYWDDEKSAQLALENGSWPRRLFY